MTHKKSTKKQVKAVVSSPHIIAFEKMKIRYRKATPEMRRDMQDMLITRLGVTEANADEMNVEDLLIMSLEGMRKDQMARLLQWDKDSVQKWLNKILKKVTVEAVAA